jgi:hypothetical protein
MNAAALARVGPVVNLKSLEALPEQAGYRERPKDEMEEVVVHGACEAAGVLTTSRTWPDPPSALLQAVWPMDPTRPMSDELTAPVPVGCNSA